jgi:hypothetical protein
MEEYGRKMERDKGIKEWKDKCELNVLMLRNMKREL